VSSQPKKKIQCTEPYNQNAARGRERAAAVLLLFLSDTGILVMHLCCLVTLNTLVFHCANGMKFFLMLSAYV
jgi:hypothetical protein